MKQIFFIAGLCSVISLTSMDKKVTFYEEKTPAHLMDQAQLRFKQQFFPSIATPTHNELLHACSFYLGLPNMRILDNSLALKDAQKYSHENNTAESQLFMRYIDNVMFRAYYSPAPQNRNMSALKKIIESIEQNKNLMNYIVTGQLIPVGSSELENKKNYFKMAVRKHVANCSPDK